VVEGDLQARRNGLAIQLGGVERSRFDAQQPFTIAVEQRRVPARHSAAVGQVGLIDIRDVGACLGPATQQQALARLRDQRKSNAAEAELGARCAD
jgi:hypothetical protein